MDQLPGGLDARREQFAEQADTEAWEAAYNTAAYWRALKAEGVPWWLAAVLVIRNQATLALTARVEVDQ